MQVRQKKPARYGLLIFTVIWLCVLVPISAIAAPYAAMVMDARTGEVLHSRNADTRLHPASLTKMMTLYIAFQAVENGEISLDTMVRVSKHAASEPPSKLGLKSGQRIALRYLIRAAAVKSANDAATAIGEAISGSEAAFSRRMTQTAKSLGMTRTTFKNAHGLTADGHLSTARDMTILGRHVLYDYPQYYNLFSRRSTDAGIKTVNNTNRRLLEAYRGADGIKTGYTRAAGFNLVASAERKKERIIATVFGGQSTASRNAKVAELLDLGFRRAPSRAPLRKPIRPDYVADAKTPTGPTEKTIRLVSAVPTSLRPKARQTDFDIVIADAVADSVVEDQAKIQAGVESALGAVVAGVPSADVAVETVAVPKPRVRPGDLVVVQASLSDTVPLVKEPEQEVVTRLSTSGDLLWGINVGRYNSRYQAEKVLLRTALAEMATLDGTLRKVVKTSRGFDANFVGMTRESADMACRRLQARNITCFMVGPS